MAHVLLKPGSVNTPDYERLFLPTVKVYFNDELVAKDRTTWVNLIRATERNSRFRVQSIAPNWRGILIVGSITTIFSERAERPPPDCCTWGVAVFYAFDRAYLVQEVRFIQSGGNWIVPDAGLGN